MDTSARDDMRALAFALLGHAWDGLSDELRTDAIDTLASHDWLLALEVLMQSTADLPVDLAAAARRELDTCPV